MNVGTVLCTLGIAGYLVGFGLFLRWVRITTRYEPDQICQE